MERTYEALGRLVPNEAVAVLERDEHGALVGAYKGYWNFKRGTVTLYPDLRHPFVRWSGTPVKKVVADRYVKCRVQNAERRVTPHPSAKPTPSPRGEGSGYVKSVTWSIKNLPIVGQEKMKF
jgi:hypothetical protein